MSEPDEDEIPYNLEVVIFPNRLCSDETVEKFLKSLKEIDGIIQILLQGPRTYDMIQRVIKVWGKDYTLDVHVGKFFIEINHPDVIIPIREAADKVFEFGYRIGAGRYSKYRETTMDHVRGHSLIFRKEILERDTNEE